MTDTTDQSGAMRALTAEREAHRTTKRRLAGTRRQLNEVSGEITRLQIQIARLSAQVGRRDQSIQALRMQLTERNM